MYGQRLQRTKCTVEIPTYTLPSTFLSTVTFDCGECCPGYEIFVLFICNARPNAPPTDAYAVSVVSD